MKFTTQFSAGLASLGLLVAASAQEFTVPGVTQPAKSAPASAPAPAQKAAPSTPAPAAPTPAPAATAAPAQGAAPKQFTDAQIAEAYGWFMGAQMGLRQLEFTKAEVEAMGRGMAGVAANATPPFNAQEIGPAVEAFLARKNQTFMGKLRAQQVSANAEFFTKLKENKAVTETPSGLRFEIVKAGTGAVAKPGQLVTMHYTGTFVNGQPFDSSVERGEPMKFLLQSASPQHPEGVIAGMFEGVQKTGVGGKLKLYVPPSLGYGDEGIPGGIPPAAALIFEVEILNVENAPAAPANPAPAQPK